MKLKLYHISDESKLLNTLPFNMKRDVALAVHMNILSKVSHLMKFAYSFSLPIMRSERLALISKIKISSIGVARGRHIWVNKTKYLVVYLVPLFFYPYAFINYLI